MDNPPDDEPCEITITAPDREWLESFVYTIIENRLAAAAHLDEMSTTYRWAGRIETGNEARVRLHTTLAQVERVKSFVIERHPFEVACVSVTRIVQGSEAYLTWIGDQVV